jgi:hypothetical protein
MNPLIEQLAEQCWVHTKEPLFGAKSPHWEFDRQKFAQLIVEKCAELADEFTSEPFDSYGKKIKHHFGAES